MATPNVTFNYLKDWLDQAIDWLHADGLPQVLQKPHDQMLKMMAKAKGENRPNEVWDLIDKLERLALRAGDTREQGEMYIHCAKMEADLANLKDALRLLQAAESKYLAFPHQRATVLWMMGCIHWAMKENVDGISTWQSAISLFSQRKLNVQVDSEKAQWYIDRLDKWEAALADAINTGELPVCNLTTETEPETTPETPQPEAPEEPDPSTEPSFFDGDALRWVSCQVSESIPAGGFGPTGFDPNPLGFLEFSEVVIEEEPYRVFSVRNLSSRRNSININSQSQYQTVHVHGTSMNATRPIPIEKDDYVLIEVRPDVEDNDIVVAEIFGVDDRATVKRLKRRNGRIQLIPESTDSRNYQIDWEREFNALDDGFKIAGMVVAIFKKKPC